MSKFKTIGIKVLLLMLLLLMGNTSTIKAQGLALKSNILYDATTTPNAGIEVRLSNKWTAGMSVALNPWSFSDNKKRCRKKTMG